jgi:putative ABC transport system substrate-binding protein
MKVQRMQRREFITLLGGTVAAWPLAAGAQQRERVRKIGVLMPYAESDTEMQFRVWTLRQELRKLGWSEGANLKVEERWSADDMDRVRAHIAELINLMPDVIVAQGGRVIPILQQQTHTIPIVFIAIADPLDRGLVPSLAKPGGNTTDFSFIEFSVIGKMLELLKQAAPRISRAALVFNPENPSRDFYRRSFEAAAVSLAVRPLILPVRNPSDIEQAIEMFAHEPNGGLLFAPDTTITVHRDLVAALTARRRVPTIYSGRPNVAAGGLMFYAPDIVDQFRRAAGYVDRILRGEKPGDLPVQQPTKFEFVINLKTAKALGLEIPPTLLAIADEVIE